MSTMQPNSARESLLGAQQRGLLQEGPPLEQPPLADQPPAVVDAHAHDGFVWTLAHELRQPLAVLSTAVAIVRNDSPSDVTARAVDVMVRHIAHMSRMVEDLLDVARLAHGKVSLRLERLDLRMLLADAASDVDTAMIERGLSFDVRLGTLPLWVRGDAQRLHQVFSNLLRNAIKFTEPGGRVILSVEGGPTMVTAYVLDTGHGIGASELARIFDLFQQVEPSTTGLGIGLNVVREIVARHSGLIRAHSGGLGKGSEFVVVLPRID